jgi:hypothetical protein
MIPAPAQGAMVVVAMANDEFCRQALNEPTILIPKFAHTSKDSFKKHSKAVVRHQLAL